MAFFFVIILIIKEILPMTIFTLFYFNDNTNDEDIFLLPLDENVEIEQFYIEPPIALVQNTIQAIQNL